jgi:ANTAR domain/GAF domain
MTSAVPNSSYAELTESFEAVAKELIALKDTKAAFDAILTLGIATVSGAEHAGITLFRRGQFETPAASGELPHRVDAIQYALGSGPCVDAVLDDTIYRSGDLGADTRWPEFGRRTVAETGVISMLSFRLFLEDDDAMAALNFYATQPDAFAEKTTLTGGVFATHAAIALAAAGRRERISNLEVALESNREIGVAMGVLMSRQLLTREQAFDLLRMTSQRTHRKLRDVAYHVVETGALDLPGSDVGSVR